MWSCYPERLGSVSGPVSCYWRPTMIWIRPDPGEKHWFWGSHVWTKPTPHPLYAYRNQNCITNLPEGPLVPGDQALQVFQQQPSVVSLSLQLVTIITIIRTITQGRQTFSFNTFSFLGKTISQWGGQNVNFKFKIHPSNYNNSITVDRSGR